MKKSITSVVVAFAIVAVVSAIPANAQRWVGADGNPVMNPNSGVTLNPQFQYEAATGMVSIINVGPNGIVDSADNSTLAGDDYGMISVLLSVADDTLTPTGVFDPFVDGIAWSAPTNFNNKIQLSGNAISASFLPISTNPTPIFQLPAGLGQADFRNADGNVTVETGVNFNVGAAGSTLFSTGDALASGAFSIIPVPEPTSVLLTSTALLGMVGFLRRRRNVA